jgi:hypothetical protein
MDWYKSRGYWFEAVQPPSLNELCTMFGFNADVPREFRDESNPAVRPGIKPEWIYGENGALATK